MWRNANNLKGSQKGGKREVDSKIGCRTEMSLAIKSGTERERNDKKRRSRGRKRYKLMERPIPETNRIREKKNMRGLGQSDRDAA